MLLPNKRLICNQNPITFCHSPILTLRIFPGIQHANWGDPTNARTSWKYPNMPKSVNPRPHLEDRMLLGSLTRFDQVWLRFDQRHGWALSNIGQPICNHLKEYIKTFRLIVHGPKTDLKRGSYDRNREKGPTFSKILQSVLNKRRPILKLPLRVESS